MSHSEAVDLVAIDALAEALVRADDKLLSDLVKLRKSHRLSQETVAERMGVSQPTVAAFERYDANPTLSSIRRYALAVGASVSHIVDDRCCTFSQVGFDQVFDGATCGWSPTPAVDWVWVAPTIAPAETVLASKRD